MAAVETIERTLQARFPDLSAGVAFGELTLYVAPARIVDVLSTCRDEDDLAFDYLMDVSGVHWPGTPHVIDPQLSTTGWPAYRVATTSAHDTAADDAAWSATRSAGVIEVTYHLLSTRHNHRVRLVVGLPDDAPTLSTCTAIYPTAEAHEREVYDFFGVIFEGHPNLTRILNPDDWIGHPLRKDYPLGGVQTDYVGGAVSPPDERLWARDVAGTGVTRREWEATERGPQ